MINMQSVGALRETEIPLLDIDTETEIETTCTGGFDELTPPTESQNEDHVLYVPEEPNATLKTVQDAVNGLPLTPEHTHGMNPEDYTSLIVQNAMWLITAAERGVPFTVEMMKQKIGCVKCTGLLGNWQFSGPKQDRDARGNCFCQNSGPILNSAFGTMNCSWVAISLRYHLAIA